MIAKLARPPPRRRGRRRRGGWPGAPGAVLVGDLLHHGQPQPGALGLGGDIGFEGALEHLFGEARAVVADASGARRAARRVRRGSWWLSSTRPSGAFGDGVQRVLHQVVDDLAQLRGVAQDGRQAGCQPGLQAPLSCAWRTAPAPRHQGVQVQRLELRGRQARVVAELVDQRCIACTWATMVATERRSSAWSAPRACAAACGAGARPRAGWASAGS
jgi:hypothetical protein